ncbi:MAG: AbrB/MazE/SpoVT family DNA-binding domain-containing protein [Candidatus Tectomicrobia bacterium]|uniref:AbrB/MazE/SpoVT family DNA-binding domain-containing protein n=1 Tax=Tectimicrobiota bacterium TaxID=2528274 RepID=A0A932GRB7_UNCTE|nr:AbrB/MazE/SpoVT family DNA-binding domain-containing protein [Candidatus Tectomicrobia bacterium]
MPYLKLSSKNQIVLPKEAREAMKVKGGDELLVVVKGSVTLVMPKPKKYAQALSGKGRGIYPRNYLEKERRSW